jgi:hypothetical protein
MEEIMMHTVTYSLGGQETRLETEDAMGALREARAALALGATECIVNDDGFHFRITPCDEISHA